MSEGGMGEMLGHRLRYTLYRHTLGGRGVLESGGERGVRERRKRGVRSGGGEKEREAGWMEKGGG